MKVIVFDGLDGVGKSFLAQKLGNKLRSLGLNAVNTHFPNVDCSSGEDIYGYLRLDKNNPANLIYQNPFATWMRYAINRYDYFLNHGELKDKIIICDRYTTTAAVFQVANMIGLKMDNVRDFTFIDYDNAFNFADIARLFSFNSDIMKADLNGMIASSYMQLIDYMMMFEYEVLRIPEPSVVFHVTAFEDKIEEILKDKQEDGFETDKLAGLREYIYSYLTNRFSNWYTCTNSFSDDGNTELEGIMNTLKSSDEFEFLKYLDI